MTVENQSAEMNLLKQKLKDTWSARDFGQIARSYESGAAEFMSRLSLEPGQKVLDVACGTGNLAFSATKSGARVTGIDIAPNLIAQAKERASLENIDAIFEEGDAENLPYSDSSFDVVVSMFGAMFAPRPELVASELVRVTRDGGTIAMANWPANSFIGNMFKTIGSLVPSPSIMPSPLLWGDENIVRQRFGSQVKELKMERRSIAFQFDLGPTEVVSFWRQYYGPTQRAFDALALEPDKQETLRQALVELWSTSNTAKAGTLVQSEFLEIVVTS